MTTNWAPTCHVRIGVRVDEDFKPILTTADVAPKALGMESFDDDAGFNSAGLDIVPFNCSVTMNNYTSADTAKVQIPLDRFDVDPRTLIQVQIQVFAGVLSRDEVLNRARLGGAGLDAGMVIGPDADPLTGNSYEIFRGFIQSHRVSRTADGQDFVEFDAVDLTAIFTSAEMYENPLKGIPKTARIDEVIQLLIYGDGIPVKEASRRFGLPGARGTIIVNDTGEVLPRLEDIHPPEAFNSTGSAKKSRTAGSNKKAKFWDIITDLCKSAGLWCYIRPGRKAVTTADGRSVIPGAELVITTPRTFYAAADAQQSSTPGVRKFIDGDNIDTYTIEKHYTGDQQPTTMEIRAYDPTIRKTRFARYPNKSTANRPSVTKKGDREEITVKVVAPMSGPGVVSNLCRMAVGLYEHQARQGLEVSITSATTYSALPEAPYQNPDGTWNTDVADMFFLRPGDPFEIGAAPPDLVNNLASSRLIFANLTQERRTEKLVEANFPPTLAAKLAASADSPFVPRFFRVVGIEWSWTYPDNGGGEDGGWAWTLKGKTYSDTRNSPDVLTELCVTGIGRA
jgi:hypothetical protein